MTSRLTGTKEPGHTVSHDNIDLRREVSVLPVIETQHTRPRRLRVSFNAQVYVAEVERWVKDVVWEYEYSGLRGDEEEPEDQKEDEDRDIADLLAEMDISEQQNSKARSRQLTRGNRYGSMLSVELGEVPVKDARGNGCPVNPTVMERLAVHREPLNVMDGIPRKRAAPRRHHNTMNARSSKKYHWPSYESDSPAEPSKPGTVSLPPLLASAEDDEESEESDGPVTPSDEVAPPSLSIGLGLPSSIGRSRTMRKAGPSRLPDPMPVQTLADCEISAEYVKGVSLRGRPFTYSENRISRGIPSVLAENKPTLRVFTTRFKPMEDSDTEES